MPDQPKRPMPEHRTIDVERPRCPWCGSPKIRAIHTQRSGDDDELIVKNMRCGTCDKPFRACFW